jgi:succinate dehydrogenase / fumarate reductase membrane anchor subunit
MKNSRFRSELKNVRGLGSAHEGTHHFWVQRMSALALVPLTVWFMINLVTQMLGANREQLAHWFNNPLHAFFTAIFLIALFLHARLGLQTIIEDYVHCETSKLALLVGTNTLNLLLCAASLFAVARLHFFGI